MNQQEIKQLIKKCKIYKKRIKEFYKKLDHQYSSNLITKEQYQYYLSKYLKNRTKKEWLDYYDNHIYNLRSKLSTKLPMQHRLMIILAIIVFSSIALYYNQYTGYVTLDNVIVKNLNLEFKENSEYRLDLDSIPAYIRLTGSVIGDGQFKVYLVNNNNKYLVIDNSILKRPVKITGFAPAVGKGKNKTTTTLLETTTTLETATILETTTTLEFPTLLPTTTLEPTITIPETTIIEVTTTLLEKLKSFNNECIETCSLTNVNNEVTLIIEVDNVKLKLDSLSYKRLEEKKKEVIVKDVINVKSLEDTAYYNLTKSIDGSDLEIYSSKNEPRSSININKIKDLKKLDVYIDKAKEAKINTDIIAINDSLIFDNATIKLKKYGDVKTIYKCIDFNFNSFICNNWQPADIKFIEENNYIIFIVNEFSAYGGGSDNFTIQVDTTKPKYSVNTTNTSIASTPIYQSVKHNILWTDDVRLAGVSFETNITGTIKNYTRLTGPVTSYKYNSTNKTVYIGKYYWKSYAADAGQNGNKTNKMYLTVTDSVKPLFAQNQTNTTTIYTNKPVRFNINWTDNVGLSINKFETNISGATINYSSQFSAKSQFKNITNITPSNLVGKFYWKSYSNDSSNNWNKTNKMYLTVLDSTKPLFKQNNTNATAVYTSTPIRFNINWTDNVMLSINKFETNITGTLKNYTTTFTSKSQFVNITNITASNLIGKFYWKSYSNDSSNNWNFTNRMFINVIDNIKPLFKQNNTNTTSPSINNNVKFNINWTDNVLLSKNYFETNITGTIKNYSTSLTAKSQFVNITNKTSASSGKFYWKSYANDSSNNWNSTNKMLITVSGAAGDTTKPLFAQNRTNITTIYTSKPVRFNINWTDDILLSINKFETNISGATINYSSQFSAKSQFKNITNITPSNLVGKFYWKSYSNDSSNNWNKTNKMFLTVSEITKPKFYYNNTNNSAPSVNKYIKFNINWTDNILLSINKFETNITGSIKNYTTQFTSRSQNINITNKTSKAGRFYWKSYTNDSSNNWNKTNRMFITVTNSVPTISAFAMQDDDAATGYQIDPITGYPRFFYAWFNVTDPDGISDINKKWIRIWNTTASETNPTYSNYSNYSKCVSNTCRHNFTLRIDYWQQSGYVWNITYYVNDSSSVTVKSTTNFSVSQNSAFSLRNTPIFFGQLIPSNINKTAQVSYGYPMQTNNTGNVQLTMRLRSIRSNLTGWSDKTKYIGLANITYDNNTQFSSESKLNNSLTTYTSLLRKTLNSIYWAIDVPNNTKAQQYNTTIEIANA